jgi:hypothetical protein
MTDTEWRTSSACSGGGCVQVAFVGDIVQVRRSGVPGQIGVTRTEWAAFVIGAKNGEFDGPMKLELCPYGDPGCPCPDGLACHYQPPNAWPAPGCNAEHVRPADSLADVGDDMVNAIGAHILATALGGDE